MKQLDLDDPRPPFQQLAAVLREEILAGRYPSGAQLPSGSELAKQFKVARQTVQNAVKELKVEGLVASRQGSGVFVRDVRKAVSSLEAALVRALDDTEAEINYLGTNPIQLVDAMKARSNVKAENPNDQVYLHTRILVPIPRNLDSGLVAPIPAGIEDFRQLVLAAEQDPSSSIRPSVVERHTDRTPMFELYVIRGDEYVSFGDPSENGDSRDFYLQRPASSDDQDHSSGPHELFFALWDVASPADNERPAGS